MRRQLGDLDPGDWFDRFPESTAWWVVTDQDGPDGDDSKRLCVKVFTGETEYLDNSQRVNVKHRAV